MVSIDCTELTSNEKLALASSISERMGGTAIALVKDENIVIDSVSGGKIDPIAIQKIVLDFVFRRKNGAEYSAEIDGDKIIVHSADPVPAMRNQEPNILPPNLKQCPFCGFVTQYEEEYMLHIRLHGFR